MRNPDVIRNFVFGVEDSLVSTVGLVSGVAAAGLPKTSILLAGIVLVFVEAFSMAAGSLLSDNSADEFSSKSSISIFRSMTGAFVMFLSYFVSGFFVLAPYIIFSSDLALPVSIVISLLALFALGAFSAKLIGNSVFKKAFTMAFVGGLAIVLGILVGGFAESLMATNL